MSFTSKMKLGDFVEQVQRVATPEVAMALDAWQMMIDSRDPNEQVSIGSLVNELMGITIDHYQDQIEELEASESQLDSRVEELEERLEQIDNIVNQTL